MIFFSMPKASSVKMSRGLRGDWRDDRDAAKRASYRVDLPLGGSKLRVPFEKGESRVVLRALGANASVSFYFLFCFGVCFFINGVLGICWWSD